MLSTQTASFIVGVDGSARSERAFHSAVRLAKAGDEVRFRCRFFPSTSQPNPLLFVTWCLQILVVHIKDETNQDKLDGHTRPRLWLRNTMLTPAALYVMAPPFLAMLPCGSHWPVPVFPPRACH